MIENAASEPIADGTRPSRMSMTEPSDDSKSDADSDNDGESCYGTLRLPPGDRSLAGTMQEGTT